MNRPPSDQNGARSCTFQSGDHSFIKPASTVGYTGALARSGWPPSNSAKSTALVSWISPTWISWLCFWMRKTLNGRMKSVV